MKTIKNLFLGLLLVGLCSSFTFADNVVKPKGNFKDQIIDLISNPSDNLFQENEEEMATIEFMVNEENEVVLLSVGSENDNVRQYVETRMNYKKLDKAYFDKNAVYELKVNFINKWAVTFKYDEPRA